MQAQAQIISSTSADIASAAVSLGALAGTVSPEAWEYLRIVRRQLQASAEQVAHMESGLTLAPVAPVAPEAPMPDGAATPPPAQ